MLTHYPYIISTVERIIHDLNKVYYTLEKEDMAVSVEIAISLGDYIFKNHLGFPIVFHYKNDVLSVTDESLMFSRSFNLLPEYAQMGLKPTLSHFINLKPELFMVHEKTLPKHRRVVPLGVNELIQDIAVYFDAEESVIRKKLPQLITEHQVFIQDTTLLKNYGLTIEVDTLTYPSLSVTRTHIRPRRRFSHYVLSRTLINQIMSL